jgi:hypothetical protein
MGGHSCLILDNLAMKGKEMAEEKYTVGDYVKVELAPDEYYVVTILAVHDGHYDVLEYSAGEIHGELYMDNDNHRLIGR